jgi:putative ABC transport system permease protein
MRKSYIARLAIRNITGHKLRSVLTITGIVIGVCFIIFLISLGYGLQRISTEEVANLEALQIIDVTPGKSKIIKINDETIERFEGLPNVDTAEPQMSAVGSFSYKTSTVEGVVYGKNVDYLDLEQTEIEFGSTYNNNAANGIIVNRALLRQVGLGEDETSLDKTITVSVNIGTEYTGEEKPLNKEEEFKIVGVINSEDALYAYIPLDTFRGYGVVNYNNAKVRVTDKEFTTSTKQLIENLGYKTTTLKDTVDQINQFFSIFQVILLSFGSIAVIIAALGMFNTLTISLLEKTREISFMKVLGTSSKDIWSLFIAEAILIGFIGATIGIIAGLGIGEALNSFLKGLAESSGNKPVEIFHAPPVFVFITFFIAMFISFMTGIYPSARASKIDPLEAMRYE